MAGYTFAAVYSSPLSRALETCRIGGLADVAIVDPDLREWDYGEFEGRTTDEIRDGAPGLDDLDRPDRRAASPSTTSVRGSIASSPARSRSTATSRSSATATASGSLPLAGSSWRPTAGALFELSTATISRLGWERERRVIELWNGAAHLGIV